jgi:uncharacterized protein (DUF1810 family)
MNINNPNADKNISIGVSRFILAHNNMYETAYHEITSGRKQSHWMWYIFPQLRGLGHSYNSNYYGLRDANEAKEYLQEPILRSHMFEILNNLLTQECNDAKEIFGEIDSIKLCSSMTLFDIISPHDIFDQVLCKFFNGRRDTRTLRILEANSSDYKISNLWQD